VVESGTTIHVAEAIKSQLGFESRNLYGIYDAVVLVEATSLDELNSKVWKIIGLDEVATTNTFVAMKSGHKTTEHKPTAYILIDTTAKNDGSIQEETMRIEQVSKSDIVLGTYNIVVEVATKPKEDLREVLTKLVKIPGILKTVTLPCFPD